MTPSLLRCLVHRTAVIAAAIAVSALPLSAQKFTCAQAASLLHSDSGARMDLYFATGTTLSLPCRDDAAAVITKLLRQSRLGTVRDTLALVAAHGFRDERMVDSVSALAKDTAQAIEKRTIYLNLLAVYADCRREVNNSPGFEHRWTVLRSVLHQCYREGRQPLSDDAREQARAGIAWMGAHDPDSRLRELSRRAAEELAP